MVVRRRLSLNLDRLVKLLDKTLPDLFVYDPSSEGDLVNMIYALLTLKKYNVNIDPEPVTHLGKTYKPDLAVEDQVAIEAKLAKTRASAANAVKQAEAYRKGGYPASIAVIYTLVDYDIEEKELERLAKNRIHVVII